MNSLVNSVCLALKPSPLMKISSRFRVVTSNSDGLFKMGRLKKKYLSKSPIIVTNPNGSVTIEGVSEKQHPLPAPWRQPEYLFRGNPGPDGSGDMSILPVPDPKRPQLQFAGLKAYEEASPEVKRVLSLEMGRAKDRTAVIKEDLRQQVGEHQHDRSSNVVKIANLTVNIWNMQKNLALLAKQGIQHRPMKKLLKRTVDMRRSQLRELRAVDYRHFEWLLEKLNLIYKPRPFVYERIIRRKHTEKLVNLLCDETRNFKLVSLKNELEEEQPKFLRKKAEILAKIMKEEQEFDLEPTVSQEQIDECLKKAQEVEEKLASGNKVERKYFIFAEKVVPEEHRYMS